MYKPIIGILGRLKVDSSNFGFSIEGNCVNNDYIYSITLAGGIPVVLPVISDEESIEHQIKRIDGLLVPGGEDFNPLIFNEEPINKQGFIFEELDEFDIKAIKLARRLNKPILGICRGIQAINVTFGGTLYQDLCQIPECRLKHIQEAKRSVATHSVEVLENTKLYSILGNKLVTNSYHHQAVKDAAPGFIINAYSKDGVIEGIEAQGHEFILGVQWHPEGMVLHHPNMLKLFKKLIDESRKNVENSNKTY